MRTTCLLALLSLWLLALAGAAPKKLEKKSIANSLAPKAVEPVEQKLDAPSAKISDEALMETPGETVDRAKKQASTTFCVEVRQNKPTYVDCNDAGGPGNKVIVVPGNEQDGSGPSGGLPGPVHPLLPGLHGPHGLHLPHHPGLHYQLPGAGGSPDGAPATIHYLLPGSDGSGLGPNGFGPNGVPYGPGGNDGGLNGILYQLPGGFPGESGPSGAGPNGVHVHVHPNGGFPSGVGGPGGSSPNGVHFHLPAGSGGVPSGGSPGSPVHLSGIECLCAGTPAVGRNGEGNDGMPSNEALAVKFLQDLQKNDKPDVDIGKAASGDQPPSDQPTGTPTILLPKSAGSPYAIPMMMSVPMMRSGSSPYGSPYGPMGASWPVAAGWPLLKMVGGSPHNAPSTPGETPSADGNAPTMRTGSPYGSPYGPAYALPIMGGNVPMMRAPGGLPTMGGMPLMGGPMMGGMPIMRAGGLPVMMGGMPVMGGPMSGGMPLTRAGDGSPSMGGMPVMNGSPMGGMPASGQPSDSPKSPTLPIMIQMPTLKAGEEPKNPSSPSGVQLTVEMPTGNAGEEPKSQKLPGGLPVTFMTVPMGKPGDNPSASSPQNGMPLVMSMPMGMPMGMPMSMPMGRAGENPMMIPTLPNGLPLPIMALPGMKSNGQMSDGTNSPAGGKDPAILLRYQPMRPVQYPMQYPMHNPMYPHGSPMMNPMYQVPGGYAGPYSPHGFGVLPHRSHSDCLQDSFQSVPAMQGLRFSRGPDESEVPTQADAEGNAEGGPAGSEHAEPARIDDKESRISHFVADERDDAANSV